MLGSLSTFGPAPARTRPLGPHRVEHIMGTAIGIDVRDPEVSLVAVDDAFRYLRGVDMRFSTYKPDSEISRLGRGEIPLEACSSDVRHVLALCDDLRRTSDGFFDIRDHRTDHAIDPSGLVKGWALEEAAFILEAAGARNYSLHAGGDIVARGEWEPGRPWRIGIRRPGRPDRVAGTLAVRDRGVATSGACERGDRIVDPHTGTPPRGLLSVTVVGPSLTYADAYATTAFAMGVPGVAWVAGHAGYGAFGITSDDRVTWTGVVEALLVRP